MISDQIILSYMRHNSEFDLSVIIPVFQNQDTLAKLCAMIIEQTVSSGWKAEILFVNDASPDESSQILSELYDTHDGVTIIELMQNVGQQKAVLIGLHYARGKSIVIMDADIQDPPEAIPQLIKRLDQGYDVVFATRVGMSQKFSRYVSSQLFKTLLRLFTNLPQNAGIFLATTKIFAQKLTQYYAPHPYIVGMIGAARPKISSIAVQRNRRPNGKSSYSSSARLKIGLSATVWTFRWRYFPCHREGGLLNIQECQ